MLSLCSNPRANKIIEALDEVETEAKYSYASQSILTNINCMRSDSGSEASYLLGALIYLTDMSIGQIKRLMMFIRNIGEDETRRIADRLTHVLTQALHKAREDGEDLVNNTIMLLELELLDFGLLGEISDDCLKDDEKPAVDCVKKTTVVHRVTSIQKRFMEFDEKEYYIGKTGIKLKRILTETKKIYGQGFIDPFIQTLKDIESDPMSLTRILSDLEKASAELAKKEKDKSAGNSISCSHPDICGAGNAKDNH